ncbi:MAG: alpha-amylase [bacterium]|nr:MAG: alpha-amylase [bacterium]
MFLKIRLKNVENKNRPSTVRFSAPKEFHISRAARDKYQFDDSLFTLSGNVIFANFHAVRRFAQKMNDKRDLINFPEQAVRAGQINAMGLIDEILHYVVELYREQISADVMKLALDWLNKKFDKSTIEQILRKFAEEFPPVAVYQRKIDLDEYLQGETEDTPNLQIVLEEMLLLWLANQNPAFSTFFELFDDEKLDMQTNYLQIIDGLTEFFDHQPPFGPQNQILIDMLRSPAITVPHSLSGQLQYMLDKWGMLLGKYLYRLLSSLDFIKEEEKMRFAFGPGPSYVYDFRGIEEEPERFSTDKDWMPRLVLIAKSALVWLDQLSKKYQRSISRLDQIPDEELDQLARWGFTGLWLIGIWERSKASQRIKRLCGNPEAEASAYSLHDYVIASELGGDEAFFNLKDRCWQRRIRVASDMVPNHTGITSKWVMEHPDWFVSLDYSPFPSYTFNGPNLSEDGRVGVFIEDHFYERTDAAVVFKRVDFWTGDEKYIYHGNDGTSMPWNDTAQLNYLKQEVREAVIQTILYVARRTPIIRFDAAMTLAKKHYQRLWFPEPGTGGDIPTRAEHGLTRSQFDKLIPNEFWREVVDRVTQERPDTLLLAEAFWLMEGYFVRTLGMHRVYNSAFMNMLKNEDNQKYRSVIKNTMEFNPEILKRYVNFINNPDEQTAVEQFGKDDKYFGVCTMMVTMPGLPMFGHGQIEGFTEKYGMEYRRAYWDEQPDWNLVHRHEREIFPLMKKRYLFAEVHNFLLYDFFATEGYVNENVFAYSNRYGDEQSLVVYNNKFEHARGWIKTSAAYTEKTGNGDEQRLVQKKLGEGLAIRNNKNYFCIFRDHINNLEFIRSNRQLWDQGLYVELGAFKYHVFLDFREVQDNEWHHYAQLNAYLDGRGVPSIDETLKELFLRPIHQKFTSLMNSDTIQRFIESKITVKKTKLDTIILDEIEAKYLEFLNEVKNFTSSERDAIPIARDVRNELEAILQLENLDKRFASFRSKNFKNAIAFFKKSMSDDRFNYSILYGWVLIRHLGHILAKEDYEAQSRSWIDECLLGKIITPVFHDLGLDDGQSWQALALIKILTSHQNWFKKDGEKKGLAYRIFKKLLEDQEVQQFLQVNRYQDILWFNKEAFGMLVGWLFNIAVIDWIANNVLVNVDTVSGLLERYDIIRTWFKAVDESNYQIEKLLEIMKKLMQ